MEVEMWWDENGDKCTWITIKKGKKEEDKVSVMKRPRAYMAVFIGTLLDICVSLPCIRHWHVTEFWLMECGQKCGVHVLALAMGPPTGSPKVLPCLPSRSRRSSGPHCSPRGGQSYRWWESGSLHDYIDKNPHLHMASWTLCEQDRYIYLLC